MFDKLSVRLKITLGSVAVAALISVAAVVAVQAQVAHILTAADGTLAASDLQAIATDITANPDEPLDSPRAGLLVFARDPAGVVRIDTMPREVHEVIEHRPPTTESFLVEVDGEEHASYSVVGEVVTTSDGTWSLWAARSGETRALALENLQHVLLIGALIMLIAFGIASWLLASAALRPVTKMRAEAAGFSAPDGTQRLPVSPANDELSRLATTLNGFLDRVQRSTEREKQLVSDAAHELRTPLAAVRTQLEIAHADFGDAKALERHIRAAETSVERLAALATGLLELSRLESPDSTSGASSGETLEAELLSSIDRARMIASITAIDITFDASVQTLDAHYALSAASFSRLIDNLTSNAVAALGDAGSIVVTLTDTERELVLEVRDSGPGMPESFIPHAFNRFSRPDDSRTASTGGSGLGLALVRAIATAAGGHVSLSNTESGFLASVHLPKM